MIIDKNNIADFVGKTVDAKRRHFHHYPLTILKKPWGYCFCDRTGTVVKFNDGETINYDFVIGESGEDNCNKEIHNLVAVFERSYENCKGKQDERVNEDGCE